MLTTFCANTLLNLAFGATAWPSGQPGVLYFALFTSAPTVDGFGGTEVSAGGYARVGVVANGSSFTAIATAGDPLVSAAAITFPQATAAWGVITYLGIFDAASGGNLLLFQSLGAAKTVNVNDTPSFAAGALSFDSNGGLGTYLQKQFLNYLFTSAAFTALANHYLALGTGGSETGLTGEQSGGSYARKIIANNTTNWPAASSSKKSNGAIITFAGSQAAAGSWSHAAIYDALTTGNMLVLLPLSLPVSTTAAGDTPAVAVGDLSINLN